MTDRLAEAGAVQHALQNPTSSGVSRLGGAGALQAAIADALSGGKAALGGSRIGARGRIYALAAGAGPLFLFQNSEKGVWYDPSDLSSMFQDSAGTTAAVVGQPVGLVLDKSKGLVLGPELVTNGTFDSDVAWAKGTGVTISGGALNADASVTGTAASQGATVAVIGKTYKVQFTVTSVAVASGGVSIQFGGVLTSAFTTTGTVTEYLTATSTGSLSVIKRGAAGWSGSIDNVTIKELPGYHATQATSTARPILRQSGSLYYLEFDGVDDFLVTPSIDFSGTDKMSVFAGVRKLSDAAIGMLCELSADFNLNNGTFNVFAPDSAGGHKYATGWKGTVGPNAGSIATFTAPITTVIESQLYLSQSTTAGILSSRANGIEQTETYANANLAGGNFGNYPLYIGRRAGASLPFNGHLYSLVVRGALSDASQITAAESYVNSKTGAY